MGSTLSSSNDHCCGTDATPTTPPPSRDELKQSIGYISPHAVPPSPPSLSPSTAMDDVDVSTIFVRDKTPPVSCLVDPVKRANSPSKATKSVRFDAKRIFEERLKTDLPLASSTSHLVLRRRYSVSGSGDALRLRQHTDYVAVQAPPPSPVRPSVLLRLQEERDKIHNEWARWAKGFKVPATFTSPPQQNTRPVTSVPNLDLDLTPSCDETLLLEPASPRKAKRKDSLDGSFRAALSVPRAVAKRNSSAFPG
ncbi:hypothetical protein SPRG_11526 [Saprolegnia parasitica CBS 223.65]|uniref:Uncharacterized protein n=1 Tax=Saprolegnia parasitica (strain CBS 223.65) TaxID=695850 RepID=A0A067BYS1_SAPPC|nr:hypothetical protein SPRG_11526 [Saprolegnia parasitica CBS 223.65]KDO23433.1 hypothetical protein SPRG_11526 [Saprolegnia parasitica CBS 223.65]|eukprot:XP_012205920.1 hypothetical protein SPRG_11526 [Saprolegnia parasitica CBS 223.65]